MSKAVWILLIGAILITLFFKKQMKRIMKLLFFIAILIGIVILITKNQYILQKLHGIFRQTAMAVIDTVKKFVFEDIPDVSQIVNKSEIVISKLGS